MALQRLLGGGGGVSAGSQAQNYLPQLPVAPGSGTGSSWEPTSPVLQRLAQELASALSDSSLVIVGDSTSGPSGLGSNTTKWPYLFAQSVATANPTWNVQYSIWDDPSQGYPSQFTGTTNGNTSITGISQAQTAMLQAGMAITGTNIPASTTISSVAATSIVISNAATGSGAGTFTAGVSANLFQIQSGQSGPTLRIWNGSLGGISFSYIANGTRLPLLVTAAQPAAVIVNLGKNATNLTNATFQAQMVGMTEQIKREAPQADMCLVVQNPTTDPALSAHTAADMRQLRDVIYDIARLKGYGLLDIYQVIENTGNVASYTNADGIHPTFGAGSTGSGLWANATAAALAFQQQAPPRTQRRSSLLEYAPSLIYNGDFQDWSSNAPEGWTLHNATGAQDTTNTYPPSYFGFQMTTTTGGAGTVYASQLVSSGRLATLKGKTVTLWARCFFPAASGATSPRIQINDGVNISQQAIPSQFYGSQGEVVLTVQVSPNATQLEVDLVTDSGTAGITSTWQGVSLVQGTEPLRLLDASHAVSDNPNAVAHLVKGAASQVANLRAVTNQLGTVLEAVNNAGEHLALNGRRVARKAVTAATYTQVATDEILGCDPTSNAIAITLLAPTNYVGKLLEVKDETGHAATNNITLTVSGAGNIDGSASLVINTNFGVARLYCSGARWQTL